MGAVQDLEATLARQLVPVASANDFDLADPRATVVIDEVRRRPELFPLQRQASDSLAGRLEMVEMGLDKMASSQAVRWW